MILTGIITGAIISFIGFKIVPTIIEYNQRTKFKRSNKLKDKVEREKAPLPMKKLESIKDIDLLNIICAIESKFNEKDLNNFHYNIKNLKIRTKDNLDKIMNASVKNSVEGGYSPFNNKIVLKKDRRGNKVLSHEMIHLASSAKKRKFSLPFTGFAQISLLKPEIGLGLTEGYTEYLNNELFTSDNRKIDSAYLFEQVSAKAIEDIVGKDDMRSLYLNADLKGLYNKLSEYYTEKEIDTLIIGLDNINKYTNYDGSNTSVNKMLSKSFGKVVMLISKGLIKKLEINNYNPGILYKYFRNMNNMKEVLTCCGEEKNKEMIDFIDDQVSNTYLFFKQYGINISLEDAKSYKDYVLTRKN